MRIIGIMLFETEWHSINKVLKAGWFPFGDYPEPKEGEAYILPQRHPIEKGIYDLNKNNPHIEVNCLVGMNGAGKSTLLDILYRVINNFSFVVLFGNSKPEEATIRYADGVKADLYYELDDTVYKIVCRDDAVQFFHLNHQGFFVERDKVRGDLTAMNSFFYTICTNFCLYSMNENEYEEVLPSPPKTKPRMINGEWVKALFNKNDGYLTPIVFSPYREKGSINVEKENRLALQRIVSIAVLSSATSGPSLIDGYRVSSVKYRIRRMYGQSFERSPDLRRWSGSGVSIILGSIRKVWERKLGEKLSGLIECGSTDSDKYDVDVSCKQLLLEYLAYKTLKICLRYREYSLILNAEELLSAFGYADRISYEKQKRMFQIWDPRVEAVVDKLCDPQNKTQINLKIRQCLNFLESGLYLDGQGEVLIEELIKGRNLKTLDDVTLLLPPSFYDVDIVFEKEKSTLGKQEISVSSMSSGERQMLYSLSYVLYHLKNIQSVKPSETHPVYNHVNLVFDEAELYFHPDYQRQFVKKVIDYIARCNLDKSIIKSIGVIIATHSPFVLTDMLTSNTLYLSEGRRKEVDGQTFGANYYDMLHESFFFEKNALGEVSTENIKRWLQKKNEIGSLMNDFGYVLLKLVGDPLIANYLLSSFRICDHVQDKN